MTRDYAIIASIYAAFATIDMLLFIKRHAAICCLLHPQPFITICCLCAFACRDVIFQYACRACWRVHPDNTRSDARHLILPSVALRDAHFAIDGAFLRLMSSPVNVEDAERRCGAEARFPQRGASFYAHDIVVERRGTPPPRTQALYCHVFYTATTI